MKAKPSFKDRVSADNEREGRRGYGYLMLPRGVRVFKVEGKDTVRLDFLPYIVSDKEHPCRNDDKGVALPGDEWYRRPYKLHRNIGVMNDSVVCPTSIGKKCPMCEYRAKLIKGGRQFDDEEVKVLKASERNLFVVVPLGHKQFEEEVHVFDISRRCFYDKLREELNEKPEFRAFFDPSEEGFTVAVRFVEERLGNNKFADASRIDFEARKQGYDADFLLGVPDLDKMLIVHPYDKIHAMFFEQGGDEMPSADDACQVSTDGHAAADDAKLVATPRRVASEKDVKTKSSARTNPQPLDDDDEDPAAVCLACDGVGENSKGKSCPVCRGTGKRPIIDDEGVKAEKSQRQGGRGARQARKQGGVECPHDHTFGVDTDKHDECDECVLWEQCYEAKKAARSAGKK